MVLYGTYVYLYIIWEGGLGSEMAHGARTISIYIIMQSLRHRMQHGIEKRFHLCTIDYQSGVLSASASKDRHFRILPRVRSDKRIVVSISRVKAAHAFTVP